MSRLKTEYDSFNKKLEEIAKAEREKNFSLKKIMEKEQADAIEKVFKLSYKPEEKLAIEGWIKNGFNEEMIHYTHLLGFYAKERQLTTSQMRNFFGEVRRIQFRLSNDVTQDDFNKVTMLLPKLAYAAVREKKVGTDKLKEVLTIAINTVIADRDNFATHFERFVDFFEAILAYHKASGGQ